MPSDHLRIGEVAEAFGLSPQALRFYEREGLLAPVRSGGGQRLYDQADIERVAVVQRLTRLGVPLVLARELAAARAGSATGDEASRKVHARLEDLRERLTRQLQECRAMLADVAAAERLVQRCFGCSRPPTRDGCVGCPVANSEESRLLAHLVWDRPA